MSEPADEIVPSSGPPEPAPASPSPSGRRRGTPLLIAAVGIVIVIGAVAASPFWAPAVVRFLPWNAPEAKSQQAPPDPALAAARAEASKNAANLQQLAQRVAALEAKPAPDLSAIQQQVAALASKPAPDLNLVQQQLAALDKTTADLSQHVAALDKAAQAQPAADPKNTALALVLLQIRDAVEIGRPFDAEYQALVALARDHPEIAAAAAPLAGPARSGVASRTALAERLRQLAPQIATAKPPPKPTWKSRIVARLRSLVTIRRIDGDEETPAETAVGAAQHALAGGDLAGAVAALDGLAGANAAAAQPWLKMAKDRLAVETALRQAQAALTASLGTAAPAAASGQGG